MSDSYDDYETAIQLAEHAWEQAVNRREADRGSHTSKGKYMNIYPFAGEIKMTKVTKDGKEVIEWEPVNMTYHADGNVGIGTPPDASASLVMGEPVERIRFMMSNQKPEAHVFAHSNIEWARVDKDLNVTHLDMELCAKGPQNVYTALAMAIWNKAIEEAAKYASSEGNDVLADSIEDLKI